MRLEGSTLVQTWRSLVFIKEDRDELSHGVLSILAAYHIPEAEGGQAIPPGLLQQGDQARQLAADQQVDQETCLACSTCQPCYVTQPAAKKTEDEQTSPN